MHSPLPDVMMSSDAPMMGLDLAGLFRRSLVLLRGAHRSHRQLETVAWRGVRCRGKCWNDEGKGANRDQARSAAKQHVHEESIEERITSTHANVLQIQLKE
jgi:hypothetical protein